MTSDYNTRSLTLVLYLYRPTAHKRWNAQNEITKIVQRHMGTSSTVSTQTNNSTQNSNIDSRNKRRRSSLTDDEISHKFFCFFFRCKTNDQTWSLDPTTNENTQLPEHSSSTVELLNGLISNVVFAIWTICNISIYYYYYYLVFFRFFLLVFLFFLSFFSVLPSPRHTRYHGKTDTNLS